LLRDELRGELSLRALNPGGDRVTQLPKRSSGQEPREKLALIADTLFPQGELWNAVHLLWTGANKGSPAR
jgi:hypothetical protein